MYLYGRIISSVAKVVEPRHMRTSSECSSLGRTHRIPLLFLHVRFAEALWRWFATMGQTSPRVKHEAFSRDFFGIKTHFSGHLAKFSIWKKLRWRLDKDLLLDIWWRMKMELHPSYPIQFSTEKHIDSRVQWCAEVFVEAHLEAASPPRSYQWRCWKNHGASRSTGNSSDFGLEKCKSFLLQHELRTHFPHCWDNMVWKQQSESKLSISATPGLNMLFWT